MSKSLAPEFMAIYRSFTGRPVLTASIADKRTHWSSLHATAGAATLSHQVVDDTAIHRVHTAGTAAEYAQVSNPATVAQWTNWVNLGLVVAASDVAIARFAPNSLRAFYLSSVGGSNIRAKQSTDSGASWSAFQAVVTPAAGDYRFAAAHERVFYTTGTDLATKLYSAGWGAAADYAACPVLTNCYGIGACYEATGTKYTLIISANGYLYLGTYVEGTGFTDPVLIYPGPSNTPAPSTTPYHPTITPGPSGYLVTYLDTYTGSPARAQPTIFQTDGETMSNVTALHLEAATQSRVTATYVASTKRIYVANENCVIQSAVYHSTTANQNIATLTVRDYHRDTRPYGSTVTVELLDPTGALKTFAQEGAAAQALRPLATLTVNRGYYLAGAPATVALDPHYILGISYSAGLNPNICTVTAVDGWGLLELWRPDSLLSWRNKTVTGLLRHILARVGLTHQHDSSTGMTYSVPEFTITPSTTGLDAIQQVLAIGGLQAIWRETGVLDVFRLSTHAPTALTIATAEIMHAAYAIVTPPPNDLRYYGLDATPAQVGGSVTNDTEAQQLGLSRVLTRFDKRLSTAAQAAIAAGLAAELAKSTAREDHHTVPLRPDVEIWDTISLSTDLSLIPNADKLRRVARIQETRDHSRGTFTTTLTSSAE